MSDAHKAALATGRKESAAVARYLDALRAEKASRRRGRKRTPETIRTRLDAITAELAGDVSPIVSLTLRQERIDLINELGRIEEAESANPEEHLPGFIAAAAAYSARKNISYAAWREQGVPAAALKQAGIRRSAR